MGCGDDLQSVVCGPGTVEQDGECVAEGGLTCGPGTVEQGGECVPDDPGAGAAPTVTAIDPPIGLVGGGESFTITGENFMALGAGDTSVLFGDSVAAFEIVSDTEITGTTPRASTKNVSVTIENANGTTSVDFAYTGLYGADGKAALAGNLWLIDPRDGYSIVIGPIQSGEPGAEVGHAVSGLAFHPDGTLFAATTVFAGTAQLLTVDPDTGEATVIGDLATSGGVGYRHVADITFAGTTLVGWRQATAAPGQAVTIDTATGEVTPLGAELAGTYGGGLVTLEDGRVILYPFGVGGAGVRGQYFSLNPETGERTLLGELSAGGNPGVCGATMFRGTAYAAVCPFFAANAGTVLATVQPDDVVLTKYASAPLNIDALASDEPGTSEAAPVAPQMTLSTEESQVLASADAFCTQEAAGSLRVVAGSSPARRIAATDLAGHRGSIAVHATRSAVRGLPLARLGLGSGVEVVGCDGSSMQVSAADIDSYVLVRNRRGLIKLVDLSTGRPAARGVVELRAAR